MTKLTFGKGYGSYEHKLRSTPSPEMILVTYLREAGYKVDRLRLTISHLPDVVPTVKELRAINSLQLINPYRIVVEEWE